MTWKVTKRFRAVGSKDERLPKCESCPYFSWDFEDAEPSKSAVIGDCRRHAPRPVTVPEDNAGESYPLEGEWPLVFPTDWCGEHPDYEAFREANKATAEGSR